ncbi:hypothetical protein DPMN_037487 [Dreissena polymorpha]|uniref:Uncharacterized protein n=1 Tax=Dreissena polymorpha TaxID=45954 RepID=A0A9D4RPV7_DREPO|nr:hypothetical protein DPMN_037487 [Dreissena polymorpha]
MRADQHLKKRDVTLKEQYSGAVGYLRWLQALNDAARAAEFLFLGEGFQSVGYLRTSYKAVTEASPKALG